MSDAEEKPRFINANDPENLVDVLTSKNEHSRVMGRALAAGALDGATLQKWFNAELARGTDIAVLIRVTGRMLVSNYASMVGCTLDPVSWDSAKQVLLDEFERVYAPTTLEASRMMAARRGVQA